MKSPIGPTFEAPDLILTLFAMSHKEMIGIYELREANCKFDIVIGHTYLRHNQKILAQFVNQASDVCKAWYYALKSLNFLARTGVRKISSVACWFSRIKIHHSVNRIKYVYVLLIKYSYSDILLKKT